MRLPLSTEPRCIGARHHDQRKGPPHRTRQRRENDVGVAARCGLEVGRFECRGDPVGEASQVHALRMRQREPIGVERADAQGIHHCVRGRVRCQRRSGTRGLAAPGLVQPRKPVLQALLAARLTQQRESLGLMRPSLQCRTQGMATRACISVTPMGLERDAPIAARVGRDGALQPVQSIVVVRRRRGCAQQAHDLRCGGRGRQAPARLVADHQRLALQQSTNATHKQSVERHQGDRCAPGVHSFDDGGGCGVGFAFQVVAQPALRHDEAGHLHLRGEGIVSARVGIEHQCRALRMRQQAIGQGISAAHTQCDPRRRAQGEDDVCALRAVLRATLHGPLQGGECQRVLECVRRR